MSRSDRDSLLQDAIDTAAHLLEKRREFFPFAVVMTTEGEIRHVQAMMSEDRPDSESVINSLVEVLKAESDQGSYRSIGIVSDVRLTDVKEGGSSDAIRVQLDDQEAGPANCYVPYTIRREDLELGALTATRAIDITFFSNDLPSQ